MLTAEQRDHIVKLYESTDDARLHTMLQLFADMHNAAEDSDHLLSDISIDLMDMGLECYRGERREAGDVLTFMAGVIFRPKQLNAMRDVIAQVAMQMAVMSYLKEGIMKPKKKKKGNSSASDD